MTRPLRMKVAGGWYHVMARGCNRQRIFADAKDYGHFLEGVEEMAGRFGVAVYAYSLMPNHYHLLIGTPEGNVSRAIQWLNIYYSAWFNRRQDRTGPVFGGRFKSVLVENSAWGWEVSAYIHLNVVAREALGLGKGVRRAQQSGIAAPPTPEEVSRRLEELRDFPWSSYRSYAGYAKKAAWLNSGAILRRTRNGAAGYRQELEDRIRQGVNESLWAKVKWGFVLGSERFAKRVRARVRVDRESEGRDELRKRIDFEAIVRLVERQKGEKRESFWNRYGDWGRDLTLWLGRRYTGLTLTELGRSAGGMDYTAVSMAIRRVAERAKKDKRLRSTLKRTRLECEK